MSGLLRCSDSQGQAGYFRGPERATPSLISWLNDVILLCFFLSWVLGYLLRKNMEPSIIAHVDNPNIREAEAGGLL